MKPSAPTILLPLLLLACSDNGPKDDVAAINKCYDDYFAALKAGEGEKAADLVDSNTLAHFDRMLQLARSADSATVSGLDVMDKLTVLSMRSQVPVEELRDLDAKGALARSASQGMMASDGPDGLSLGTVTVTGDEASAPLKMYGFPTPATFTFKREQGGWRIDLTTLFDMTRQALGKMGSTNEATDQAVLELLKENLGEDPPAGVWHPAL